MPPEPQTPPFDVAEHRRLIAESLRRLPEVHDAEALERLGQASLADELFPGGGAMTSVPEPRVGERRRCEAFGLVLECVGVTPLGWARCRLVANPSRTESVPADLWADYAVVEVARG